jgi:XTP/dITP diphosphohydrolase
MKLVFATHNLNKLREVKAMLPDTIELLSLAEIGCDEDIPETASTIEGNALIKTKYVKDNYGYDCFADDTGLEVLALNNEPGVFSARYAGPENNADANMAKLLKNLAAEKNKDAQFKTAISLIFEGKESLFLGICKGVIIDRPRGDQGFGYDPIFQPSGSLKTMAELTPEQKSEIGHRGIAMRKLIDFLSQ